jgi:CspA family cold shock protein
MENNMDNMNDDKIYTGICEWFSRGYGFIKPDIGEVDIFAHYSDLVMEGFKTLKKGQRVSYSIAPNHRGQPKAVNVQVIAEPPTKQ